MWIPIAEVKQYIDMSERTAWRKVGTGELQKRKVYPNGGGKPTVEIFIGDYDLNSQDYDAEKSANGANPDNSAKSVNGVNSANLEKSANSVNSAKSDTLLNNGICVIDDVEQKDVFIETLPLAELEKMLPANKQAVCSEASSPDWDRARLVDKQRAWAKFRITKAFIRNRMEQKALGNNFGECDEDFVKRLLRGLECIDDFNLLKLSSISSITLRKWNKLINESGSPDNPVCLLEDFRFCGRKSEIDIMLRNQIRQLSADDRNLDPHWIYQFLTDTLELNEQALPVSESTLRGMVRSFRKERFTVALGKGSEAIRTKVKLHTPRVNDLLPGELWESDGHKCNLLVKSPFYYHRNISYRYLVRPVLTAWVDVATGVVTGYRVGITENKGTVKNSLRDGIARFGLPKKARMDNGPAYKNVEFSPREFYRLAQGKTRLTKDQKIAVRMIESGDKGLYLNMGIDYSFTLPKNPESKGIEAFWDYGIAPFESSFKSFIGNKFDERPEKFKGIENKVLVRKYPDLFPTWDEFCELLDRYIILYNAKQRKYLQTIDGELLSPLEAYNQVEHIIPSELEIQSKMRDPYIEMRVVQRSMIEKNGILYWHPVFAQMIGNKVGIYYDEQNLKEITICNERGQIYNEKAVAIDPGLQSGDNLSALIENNRRNKINHLCYLGLCDVSGAMKIEKMLTMVSKELLPLSNTKQLAEDDIRYLNFDEALDSVAGNEDINDELTNEPTLSDEEKALRDDIKKDIEGMFGN